MPPVRSPSDTGTLRVYIDGKNLPCYRTQCKNCDFDGTGRCISQTPKFIEPTYIRPYVAPRPPQPAPKEPPNPIAIFIIVFVIAVVYFPTIVGTGLGIRMIFGILLIPVVILILLGMKGLFSLGILADINQMNRR